MYVAKPWNQIITNTHTNFTTGIYMGITKCGLGHHLFFNFNILIFSAHAISDDRTETRRLSKPGIQGNVT